MRRCISADIVPLWGVNWISRPSAGARLTRIIITFACSRQRHHFGVRCDAFQSVMPERQNYRNSELINRKRGRERFILKIAASLPKPRRMLVEFPAQMARKILKRGNIHRRNYSDGLFASMVMRGNASLASKAIFISFSREAHYFDGQQAGLFDQYRELTAYASSPCREMVYDYFSIINITGSMSLALWRIYYSVVAWIALTAVTRASSEWRYLRNIKSSLDENK